MSKSIKIIKSGIGYNVLRIPEVAGLFAIIFILQTWKQSYTNKTSGNLGGVERNEIFAVK